MGRWGTKNLLLEVINSPPMNTDLFFRFAPVSGRSIAVFVKPLGNDVLYSVQVEVEQGSDQFFALTGKKLLTAPLDQVTRDFFNGPMPPRMRVRIQTSNQVPEKIVVRVLEFGSN